MKYLLIVLFLFVVGFSCTKESTEPKTRKTTTKFIDVIIIDGCEYITFEASLRNGGVCIIHKQNCKFCKEKTELQKLNEK